MRYLFFRADPPTEWHEDLEFGMVPLTPTRVAGLQEMAAAAQAIFHEHDVDRVEWRDDSPDWYRVFDFDALCTEHPYLALPPDNERSGYESLVDEGLYEDGFVIVELPDTWKPPDPESTTSGRLAIIPDTRHTCVCWTTHPKHGDLQYEGRWVPLADLVSTTHILDGNAP